MIRIIHNLVASPITQAALHLGGGLPVVDDDKAPVPQEFRSTYYLGKPGWYSRARANQHIDLEIAERGPRALTQAYTTSSRLAHNLTLDEITRQQIQNLQLTEKQLSVLINLRDCYTTEEIQTLVNELSQSDYTLYGTRVIDLFFDLFDSIDTHRIIKDLRKIINTVIHYQDRPSEFLYQFISLHFLAALGGEFNDLKAERSIVKDSVCILPDLYDEETETAVEIKCIMVLSHNIHRQAENRKYGRASRNNGVQSRKYDDWLGKYPQAKLRYIIVGEPDAELIAGLLEEFSAENRERIAIHFYAPWDLLKPYTKITQCRRRSQLDDVHHQFSTGYSDTAQKRVQIRLRNFDNNTLDAMTAAAFAPNNLKMVITALDAFVTANMSDRLLALYQPALDQLKTRCEDFPFADVMDEYWPGLKDQLILWRRALSMYLDTPRYATFANLVDQTINLNLALDNIEQGALANKRLLPQNTTASLDTNQARSVFFKVFALDQQQAVKIPCGKAEITLRLQSGLQNGTVALNPHRAFVTSDDKTTPAKLEFLIDPQKTPGCMIHKLTDAQGYVSVILLTPTGVHVNTGLDEGNTDQVLLWAQTQKSADAKIAKEASSWWLNPTHISPPTCKQKLAGDGELFETTLTYPDGAQLKFSTVKQQGNFRFFTVGYKGNDDEDYVALPTGGNYKIRHGIERGFDALAFGITLNGITKVAKPQFLFFIEVIFVLHQGFVLPLANKKWSRQELRKKFDEQERKVKMQKKAG